MSRSPASANTNEHWEVIAKMYQCPECGWVTECYPNCPIEEEGINS